MEGGRQRHAGADGRGVPGDQSLSQLDRLPGRFDRSGLVAAFSLDAGQSLVCLELLQLGPRVPIELADQGQRLADPRINQRLAIWPQLFRGRGTALGTKKAIDGADGPIAR
jgi:hypothetical protein